MPLQTVNVVPYDPSWPDHFTQAARRLAPIFGRGLHAIHHIGSTAVPHMCAKPIIDLLIVVDNIEAVDALNGQLDSLGYQAHGENGIPGRRYFTRGEDQHRSHNAHTFAMGHPEISRCLDFRDYLRSHPEVAQAYCRLKKSLALKFPQDLLRYIAGKDPFIQETLQQAVSWKNSQNGDGSRRSDD